MSDSEEISLPSLSEIIANPTRYHTPEQRAEAEASARPSATRPAAASRAPGGRVGPPIPSDDGDELADAETIRQQLAKKSDPKPESPQEPYRAHAAFLNRLKSQERTFYCVFKDCTYRGFPYSHYGGIRLERPAAPGGGPVVTVRFIGSDVEDVRLEGAGLRFVADCIGLGIMPWVWEKPEGLSVAEGATVISRIAISKIERR